MQNYYDKANRCNNSTLIEIEKNEFFISNKKYLNNNPTSLYIFYNILYDDYYTLYINNNLNKSNDNNFKVNKKKNGSKENGDEKKEEEEINDKYNIENTKKFLKLLVTLKNKYSKYRDLTEPRIFAYYF